MVEALISNSKNSSAELVGNIVFVPVIRQRLNFAVLVRRAFYDFACGPDDVVAVELPRSALTYVLRAAALLPEARLVVAYSGNSEYREVLPVVPCDAVIEAVRYANEKRLQLEAIDCEVLPAHLWQRHCLRGADWPDDALVLHSGPRSYVALISERLATPMARLEPIDSWREEYMADRLRELSIRYRRVFCVCDATHLEPIKIALTSPSHTSAPEASDSLARPTRYEIVQPNEQMLLSYLDDIPAVTQIFEEIRQSDAAIHFDKTREMLKLVAGVCREEFQRQLSIHEWIALSTLVRNLAQASGRLTPTTGMACAAASSCIDSLAGELLLQRFLKYGRQFLTKSVDVGSETMFVMLPSDIKGIKYVSRSCNPFQKTYLPIGGTEGEDNDTNQTFCWPPYNRLIDSMTATACKRALNTTFSDERVIWHTEKFTGSLADGIDVRATLRDALRSPHSALYVRVRRKQKRQRTIDSLDPVVWVLQPDAEYGDFGEECFGIPPSIVTIWYYETERQTRHHDKAKEEFIQFSNCYGFMLFTPFSISSIRDVRKKFGDSLEWRVPRPHTLPTNEELAHVLRPAGSRSWHAQLMLTALGYCKHGIICMLPNEMLIDEEVTRECAKRGKTLFRVSLDEFDRSEVSKLKTHPIVTAPFGFTPEDVENTENPIVQRFASLMDKFWV